MKASRKSTSPAGSWCPASSTPTCTSKCSSGHAVRSSTAACFRAGVTTAICDPHEIANVIGRHGDPLISSTARSRPSWTSVCSSRAACLPPIWRPPGAPASTSMTFLPFRDPFPRCSGWHEFMNFPRAPCFARGPGLHGQARSLLQAAISTVMRVAAPGSAFNGLSRRRHPSPSHESNAEEVAREDANGHACADWCPRALVSRDSRRADF